MESLQREEEEKEHFTFRHKWQHRQYFDERQRNKIYFPDIDPSLSVYKKLWVPCLDAYVGQRI